MVWGMMSFQALSELHFLPLKQTINAGYYVEDILTKVCLTSLNRTADIGSILERKFMPNMSNAVFMQDGAPAHTAIRTQKWCRENLASSGRKRNGQETRLTLTQSKIFGKSRNLSLKRRKQLIISKP